jgi:hypothetical protein
MKDEETAEETTLAGGPVFVQPSAFSLQPSLRRGHFVVIFCKLASIFVTRPAGSGA